jgi:hypothetical protein
VIPGRPDDLDREIEEFYAVEQLREVLAASSRPLDSLPEPVLPPPGGGGDLVVWAYVTLLWLFAITVAVAGLLR